MAGWTKVAVDLPSPVAVRPGAATAAPGASDIDAVLAEAAPPFRHPRGRAPGATRALLGHIGDARSSVTGLLLALFDYFLPTTFLQKICDWKNAHAQSEVVVERRYVWRDGRVRDVLRQRRSGDAADLPTRLRRKSWARLTVPELCVFIGIMFKAGMNPKRRFALYWTRASPAWTTPTSRGPCR